MRLEVVSLRGRTTFLECEDEERVQHVRQSLSDREGVPAELLRLTCAGRELADTMVVSW